MIQQLKIGGKTRPFVFGFYAMLACEEDFKIDLAPFVSGTAETLDWMKALPFFVYSGLRNAEYTNPPAQIEEYTPNHIRSWIDQDPDIFSVATSLCTKSLEAWVETQTTEDGGAKKKKVAEKSG